MGDRRKCGCRYRSSRDWLVKGGYILGGELLEECDSHKRERESKAQVRSQLGISAASKVDANALVEAARAVCSFDWSDNDWDAVSAVNNLKAVLERLDATATGDCQRCDYECFCQAR